MTSRRNYRIQSCPSGEMCRTCRHCFETVLCGMPGRHYFCVIEYQKRKPLFLRVAMKLIDDCGSFVRFRRNWDRFANHNRVAANGVYDRHEFGVQ